jgi:hypothetical protein
VESLVIFFAEFLFSRFILGSMRSDGGEDLKRRSRIANVVGGGWLADRKKGRLSAQSPADPVLRNRLQILRAACRV